MKQKINTKYLIKYFFSNYLWFGIAIVMLSAIAESYFDMEIFLVKVSIDAIEAIGIAIVVAAFFTFASGTSEFLGRISGLLRDIVIGKDFLTNLDPESKKNVLSSIIKPSYQEKKIYSNIEDYFNRYINKTMEVTKTSVRSNNNLTHRAYICSNKKTVTVETDCHYRLYPGIDGYTPVKVAFYAEDKNSICTYVHITTPIGSRESFTGTQLEFKETDSEAGLLRLALIDTSKFNNLHPHLDVEIKMIEYGYDHWGVAEFQFLMPSDGFNYHLRCEDNLEIKQYSTFIYGAKCFIDKVEKHEISISCTEWINEGTGFSIVVGPNAKIACNCWEKDDAKESENREVANTSEG